MSIRILHIVGIMNMGGIENLLMNIYRQIDKEIIQFDFLVTREEEGIFDNEIRSLGGEIYNIPKMSSIGYKKYRQLLYEFFCCHPEYKIIHCHRDALCSIYLKEAKRANVTTRIAHCHAKGISGPKNIRELINKLIKVYFIRDINKYLTHAFACSSDAGKWIYSNNDFQIIKNAIPLANYEYKAEIAKSLRKKYGYSEDDFIIGHVGRMDSNKNQEFLLDIFLEFQKCNENSHLCFVGDGELRSKLKEITLNQNLNEKILFLGNQKNVNELMMMFDVFVFPSLMEGLGIVLIEAQATGLKCLVSNQIPEEANMQVKLVKSLSLEEKESWVSSLEELYSHMTVVRKNRKNYIEEITNNGYCLDETVKKLQEFYLDQLQAESKF